jgi:hypothetical protein
MELTGRIIAVLEEQGGVSKTGNNWKKQEYVLETQEQYPKKVCFQIFGEDRIAQAAIRTGEILTVFFDINSQEYQGRWYTRVSAWKVERTAGGATPPATGSAMGMPPGPVPAMPPSPDSGSPEEGNDDLPF